MRLRAVIILLLAGLPVRGDTVSLLDWNLAGNGAVDWTTNASQVQAIGRIVQYLRPDLLTLQEVPFPQVAEMTNFVTAFLPGYQLARFSGTDGYICSVILSRFPILREQRWLDGVLLNEFGYDGRFTRDVFEAEISVSGWPMPLHLFTTHLKSGFDAESVARRAAEALAVSNFVVNTFLPGHSGHPFILTGDFNEDHLIHATTGAAVVPALANNETGLRLTSPVHPETGSERTFSIRTSLQSRLDYILPNGILYSNIVASQIFRTGLPGTLPPGLFAGDDRTASDHLPILMVFENPFSVPFRITRLETTDELLSLWWEALPGRRYTIEWSGNLVNWSPAAVGLLAGGTQGLWNTTRPAISRYYRIIQDPPLSAEAGNRAGHGTE